MYKTEYGSYPATMDNHQIYILLNGGSVDKVVGVGKENPRHIQFMAFNKHDINAQEQIVDSWGTPFRFFIDNVGVTVVSAGKDKVFGTADDVIEKTQK